jgi:hypothetical protein
VTFAHLAAEFGISREHARRLARGEQRPSIGRVGDEEAPAAVMAAVAAFLDGMDLDAGGAVLAATARALGRKLDACSRSDATAAASAPRVAAALVDVVAGCRRSRRASRTRLTLSSSGGRLAGGLRLGSASATGRDGSDDIHGLGQPPRQETATAHAAVAPGTKAPD